MICDHKREDWVRGGGCGVEALPHTWTLPRGCCGEGWTPRSVSSNRSCLQWLGLVDRGSASGQNQMERSLSTGHLLPPFQSVLTGNDSPAHTVTKRQFDACTQHAHKHTHTHGDTLLLIMSNIRWWNKHCEVIGESLADFPPTPAEASGSQGHTLQLYHHYTLVHSAASSLFFSSLNPAGTQLISLSSRLSCLW